MTGPVVFWAQADISCLVNLFVIPTQRVPARFGLGFNKPDIVELSARSFDTLPCCPSALIF